MTPSERDVSPRLSAESSAMLLKAMTNPSTGGAKRTTFRKRANMTCRLDNGGRGVLTIGRISKTASWHRTREGRGFSAPKVNWDEQERHVPFPLCYRASG